MNDFMAVPRSSAGELRKLLRFRPDAGQIWLGERRMVLLHADYLRGLREELFRTLDHGRARGVLFRMGFASGQADAALVRDLLPNAPLPEVIRLGPEIHGLEGLVVGTVDRLEFDVEKKHFYCEGSWQSSWESEVQLEKFGESTEPGCYSQVGYASGYVSALMGMMVVFKETACLSCGDGECKIVARPAVAWGRDDPWVQFLEPQAVGSEIVELRQQVAKLEKRLDIKRSQGDLIGASSKFRDALQLLEKAADSTITVLLLGETGVGKEAFARWLHVNGPRADKPFVAVNCGAIPEELIESELFGADAGAFTGAKTARAGRFERADGGTIFLDELGELSAAAQVKLLRVLQTGEVERLGSVSTKSIDVRVIAATNADLAGAVAGRTFRPDLYYRLNSFPVKIAPLRERRADILPLIETFLTRAQLRHGKSIRGISNMATKALVAYDWPGNVRELENIAERAVVLAAENGEIGVEHLGIEGLDRLLQDAIVGSDGKLRTPGDDAEGDCFAAALTEAGSLRNVERAIIERALTSASGNVAAAARKLGVTRAQLDYRVRVQQITVPVRQRD